MGSAVHLEEIAFQPQDIDGTEPEFEEVEEAEERDADEGEVEQEKINNAPRETRGRILRI